LDKFKKPDKDIMILRKINLKVSLLFLSVLVSLSLVLALANPSATYCENMNYTYNMSDCIFDDGNSCEAWAFWNGSCGSGYVKELGCANAGERASEGKGCCEGLSELVVDTENAGICPVIVGAYPICSDCGNKTCEAWEDKCNCPHDCSVNGSVNSTQNKTDETGFSGKRDCSIENRKLCYLREDCIYSPIDGKCVNNPDYGNLEHKEIKKEVKAKVKEKMQDYFNSGDCPTACICAGKTVKCNIDGGRVMMVVAGNSGNIIIQTKEVNATTSVIITRNESGVFANISGEERQIRFMPDEASEKALKRLKIKACNQNANCSIELKEFVQQRNDLKKAIYELRAERKSRLFGLFKKKMQVRAQVDSETGELIMIQKPWWAFMASEPRE
jgi:hypothetical protein